MWSLDNSNTDPGNMFTTFQAVNMTEKEDTMVVEAHVRALVLLEDALKKKDRLLLDKEMKHKKIKELNPNCPFLHQQLLWDLIHKLQEVHLLKDGGLENETTMATVYPGPSNAIILCQLFWEKKEYLDRWSRPGSLILAAAHVLGYVDNVWDKCSEGTLTASDICDAFEYWMKHDGGYENNIYTCCGEQCRDSVCEESRMSRTLLPYMNQSDTKDLKQATLDILMDSQRKCLLVEDVKVLQASSMFPIITTSLVRDLMRKLKEVKFKCDTKPGAKIAYTDHRFGNIIYVCPFFWDERDHLCQGSRLGTIILYVAQLLGYPHLLGGATKVGTSDTTVLQHHGSNLSTSLTKTSDTNTDVYEITPPFSLQSSSCSNTGEGHLSRRSETCGINEITADTICSAFEVWMNHKGNYEDGSYTCCMETARHSVCKKSVMSECLKEMQS